MLSWPSSQRMRYRGEGSPRTTSSMTPQRGRRLVDSGSATTRLPTSKVMLTSYRSCLLSERVAPVGPDHLAGLRELVSDAAIVPALMPVSAAIFEAVLGPPFGAAGICFLFSPRGARMLVALTGEAPFGLMLRAISDTSSLACRSPGQGDGSDDDEALTDGASAWTTGATDAAARRRPPRWRGSGKLVTSVINARWLGLKQPSLSAEPARRAVARKRSTRALAGASRYAGLPMLKGVSQ